jgi:hypothetical protein
MRLLRTKTANEKIETIEIAVYAGHKCPGYKQRRVNPAQEPRSQAPFTGRCPVARRFIAGRMPGRCGQKAGPKNRSSNAFSQFKLLSNS